MRDHTTSYHHADSLSSRTYNLTSAFVQQQTHLHLEDLVLSKPPEGRPGIYAVSPCLESHGFQCCSFCFILFCFWRTLLTSFPLNLYFPKGRLFCVALVCLFFERLGDEYFSWWYGQHMLPSDTGISLYALYTIFNLRLFLSILFL